jgi:succinate dehydrogenase/fumarate reductase cytochrome b subunit
MLAFVICHLTAHGLLIVSFERAEAALNVLMYPWRTWLGTGLLLTAFFVHYANALWSIYLRRDDVRGIIKKKIFAVLDL